MILKILVVFTFILCLTLANETQSVLFIYSGGTIGMKKVNGHYTPIAGYLSDLMRLNPQLNDVDLNIRYDILEYSPLLDSSNMNCSHWIRLASDIADNYDNYDGFVIIHGTDTLAYTSSAISFLLENLNKTVVVTGSQIPLVETYSDGWNNLIGSMIIAGKQRIPEVTVFFNNVLYRGNRVRKFSNWDLSAFASGMYAPLGFWGGSFFLDTNVVLKYPTKPFRLVPSNMENNVAMFPFFPSIPSTYINHILEPHIKGLVILAYGMGNGPDFNTALMNELSSANEKGIILVDATQCFKGNVDLTHYGTGDSMAQVGCISALDMTPEAAFTKLMFLLGRDLSVERIKELMTVNLRGELTGRVEQVAELLF
ncbi:hypothetical protein RCL1_008415 [Eukaryota sp. TZLM3-RCL]